MISKNKQCFAKLRMSAHSLELGTRRFGKNEIPRFYRHCKCCFSKGQDVLGDKVDFVIMCLQSPFSPKRKENVGKEK